MNTALKDKDTKLDVAPPEPPKLVKASAVQWQSEGFVFREMFVRLPANMIAQDLQDTPEAWRPIQESHATALRRFDRVTVVAHDESWMVKDSVVIEADATKVVLGDFRIVKIVARSSEWEDETVKIKWAGSGYAVFSKPNDVQIIPGSYQTVDAARMAYSASLPRRVA